MLAAASAPNCDVVWNSPSHDSSGSMPIGNGDIGLNVWVEEGGDLLFYISKTDAWSGDTRLVKLGRVRVKLSPNPFAKRAPFLQTLRTATGEIEIRAGAPAREVSLRVWVDANAPVVRVEASGPRAFRVEASLEMWRTAPRTLTGQELVSAYGMEGGPEPVVVESDTLVQEKSDRVVWYHRNQTSAWPGIMKLQGLESLIPKLQDPLLNRTFGGAIEGPGFRKSGPATLRSAAAPQHLLSIYLLTKQTPTADAWIEALAATIAQTDQKGLDAARTAHRRWWSEFWNRSYIRVSGTPEAERVSQSYALQRFVSACAGRGAQPVKFNGSIFTVDAREPDQAFDADYRRWGGPYWFQNTRLVYWPMLASGDYDLMRPLFRMYLDALPLARERTRLYFHHEGVFFPETMHFWGTYANSNYGWNRDGKIPSYVENTYIRHYFSGMLELLVMMTEYFDYSQDRRFLEKELLPFAEEVFTFYRQHYKTNSIGTPTYEPAQSLETWQEVVNPLPEIAGLRYAIDRLLELPGNQNISWFLLRGTIPPLPQKTEKGRTVLLPAEKILGPIRNSENPELYAIFPYRLYGLQRPQIEVARHTFEDRRFKRTGGWSQDAIQAACLGLADTAAKYVVENFSTSHSGSRFPAFWGPNFDWVPDQDHGNAAMLALQYMLLQNDGGRIVLFPAWPKNWNVEFKLRAPQDTLVEGAYRNGRLEKLDLTPERREMHLVQMTPQ
jgi:alpha-L-fucosidase 2